MGSLHLILSYIRTDFFCVLRICSFLTLFFFDCITSSDGVMQSTQFFLLSSLLSLRGCTGLWQCDIVTHELYQRELHILIHFDFVSYLLCVYNDCYNRTPLRVDSLFHDCDSLPSSARVILLECINLFLYLCG